MLIALLFSLASVPQCFERSVFLYEMGKADLVSQIVATPTDPNKRYELYVAPDQSWVLAVNIFDSGNTCVFDYGSSYFDASNR